MDNSQNELFNLLPCPFCGGNPKMEVSVKRETSYGGSVKIYCQECGAHVSTSHFGVSYDGKVISASSVIKLVISRWNKRIKMIATYSYSYKD